MAFARRSGMDHRWDELLQAEHRRRVEEERYWKRRPERDRDVERRDELASAGMRNRSPWEIGASHWDQRDLFTTNSRIDETGYARGPSVHPPEGSYAYHRSLDPDRVAQEMLPARPPGNPNVYEREAWPWLNYDNYEHGRKGWWHRADDSIREDACECLAYDPRVDARDIEVHVRDAEVVLDGTVGSRAEKRLAERLVETVRGVVDVHNRLTIRKADDDTSFTVPEPVF
jgi:hypothetical protein